MKQQNRIRIAFIAGRLISGKRIASLYDMDNLMTVDIDNQPEADCLREFDLQYRDFSGSDGDNFHCRLSFEKKHAIALTIKGTTFIGYITGSTAVFMGKVQGDSISIYDREDSLHLHYRISGCVVDRDTGREICRRCWPPK